MTAFEIAVPVMALAIAGIGTLILHRQTKKLDARLEAARTRERHPAE